MTYLSGAGVRRLSWKKAAEARMPKGLNARNKITYQGNAFLKCRSLDAHTVQENFEHV